MLPRTDVTRAGHDEIDLNSVCSPEEMIVHQERRLALTLQVPSKGKFLKRFENKGCQES